MKRNSVLELFGLGVLASVFGIALRAHGDGFVFATVDDNTANTVLDIWIVQ